MHTGHGFGNSTHSSFYGACLEFIRDDNSSCPYNFNIPMYVAYPYAGFGLLNSGMSLLAFRQPKYKIRLTSRILRYSSIIHFIAAVLLLVKFSTNYLTGEPQRIEIPIISFMKRAITFFYLTALNMSQGIIAYLSSLKIVNSKFPLFIFYSPHANTLTYLVLMTLVGVASGIHLKLFFNKDSLIEVADVYANVAYFTLTMVVVVSCNASWVILEKTRRSQQSSLPGKSSSTGLTTKMLQYAILSSALFVSSTLPATIFFVLPLNKDVTLTCPICQHRLDIGDYLIALMFSVCYFDNVLYCIQSEQYRNDLLKRISKLVFCRKGSSDGIGDLVPKVSSHRRIGAATSMLSLTNFVRKKFKPKHVNVIIGWPDVTVDSEEYVDERKRGKEANAGMLDSYGQIEAMESSVDRIRPERSGRVVGFYIDKGGGGGGQDSSASASREYIGETDIDITSLGGDVDS